MTAPRVIIAGARDISDGTMVFPFIDRWWHDIESCVLGAVLSGTCRGVDQIGEYWAKSKGFAIERHPAQWRLSGKAAGPLRNQRMAERATHCWIFRRDTSRGSYDMATRAIARGLMVEEAILRADGTIATRTNGETYSE